MNNLWHISREESHHYPFFIFIVKYCFFICFIKRKYISLQLIFIKEIISNNLCAKK